MHDAAVESANFTECVPAPPGESCGSPVTEGAWTTSQPVTLSRRPTSVSAAASVGGNLRTVTRLATIGCRTSMGYDSFQ